MSFAPERNDELSGWGSVLLIVVSLAAFDGAMLFLMLS
jgi:hypothetical protein